MRMELIALAVVFAAILWWIYARDRARIKASRGGLFDGCRDLFESCAIAQDGVDMAVLDGRYRGHDFRILPIIDHVNLRKLPSLWLLVTLRERGPYEGAVDFLVRPQNTEFYSPSSSLPVALEIPPAWPAHATLRTDRRDAMPPLPLIGRHMGFFDDPKAKELLVAPLGVRLVYQADQGRRAHYLVLRQAEFEGLTVAPELLRDLMDRAIALHYDLQRSVHGQAPDDGKTETEEAA